MLLVYTEFLKNSWEEMLEENKSEDTYESKKLITRVYFRTKVWLAVKTARLQKQDVILDFGCGSGWLEKKLRNYSIFGYDINPKKTFIEDYREIKPTKIFVLDVFEHIPKEEIEKIIDEFKKSSNKFEIIISLPTENIISRKIRRFVGKPEVPKEHITNHRDVIKILKNHFKLKRKINFFTVSYILVYEFNRT